MVSESDKSAKQDHQGTLPTVNGSGEEAITSLTVFALEKLKAELDYVKRQNNVLDAMVQEKTDKLRKMQIATYKVTTTKQYKLIEEEAQKVQLVQENKPQDYFYFPKIGMGLCQCGKCGPSRGESYEEGDWLYRLTGIGHFSGHSGFKVEDARYIAEFLNKHKEYQHELANLDKARYL